ncbi:MAG: ORF6N domain-containing protein [Betaproteobacteria bacterium]|nr:ORF6N domain-containing protein [Betaproteobacteria bacterium]
MNPVSTLVVPESIAQRILLIREHKAILDAELYGAETRALNQAVRRNIERFRTRYDVRLLASGVYAGRREIEDSSRS